MTKTQQIKAGLALAQMALSKLESTGYQVLDISFGNRRPVIKISAPGKARHPTGAEVIRVRGINGITEHIYAASFHGCLITWAADVLAA